MPKGTKKTQLLSQSLVETTIDEVATIETVEVKEVSEKEITKLDSQALDMLKRVRDQKLVSGGKDPFFVSEKDKKSNFVYKWGSTDKDTPESIESLEEIGWRKVNGYRELTTGGYTAHGQPGKHILMCLPKIVHDELVNIQNELNERKKNAVFAPELLSKDGGKNKMGMSAKRDSFLNDL